MTRVGVVSELEEKVNMYKIKKESVGPDPMWQHYFDLVYAYKDALLMVPRMEDNEK